MQRYCKTCGNLFYAKPGHVRRGWGIYCSRKCHYADTLEKIEKHCGTCAKKVFVPRSKVSCSKSGKFFCDKSCQTIWRNQYYSGDKHLLWKDGLNSYQSILDRHKVPRRCLLCGITDIRVLVTHHVDENHRNNVLSNLARLCHNCHHLVHNRPGYKAKLVVPLV